MAFSYNPALPTARDRLRWALGDTDAEEPLMDDVTYNAVLTANGQDEALSKISIAAALVAQYSREPDRVRKDDGTEVSWKDRLAGWRAIANSTITSPASASGGGFNVRRAQRFEDSGAEYYAGRRSIDQDY